MSEDGATWLDARMVRQVETGDLIGMMFDGVRQGSADVMARLARGEFVDPAQYYFRISARFSTASPALGWMNRIVAVGTGHRPPGGLVYNVFEVR